MMNLSTLLSGERGVKPQLYGLSSGGTLPLLASAGCAQGFVRNDVPEDVVFSGGDDFSC